MQQHLHPDRLGDPCSNHYARRDRRGSLSTHGRQSLTIAELLLEPRVLLAAVLGLPVPPLPLPAPRESRQRRARRRAVAVPLVARPAQREFSHAPRARPDPKLVHAMASAIVAVDFENGP